MGIVCFLSSEVYAKIVQNPITFIVWRCSKYEKLKVFWKQFMQNILQSLQGFKALSLRALKHQGHRKHFYSDEEKNAVYQKNNLTKRNIADT